MVVAAVNARAAYSLKNGYADAAKQALDNLENLDPTFYMPRQTKIVSGNGKSYSFGRPALEREMKDRARTHGTLEAKPYGEFLKASRPPMSKLKDTFNELAAAGDSVKTVYSEVPTIINNYAQTSGEAVVRVNVADWDAARGGRGGIGQAPRLRLYASNELYLESETNRAIIYCGNDNQLTVQIASKDPKIEKEKVSGDGEIGFRLRNAVTDFIPLK